MSSWTDYFIITTVSSSGHLKGVLKHINLFLREYNIVTYNHHKHLDPHDGWVVFDCGSIVIHLMNNDLRNFYELEKLWFNGTIVYQSSKSS